MTAMNASRRHWRSDGTEPLPSGAEAMGEPFAAFPSWFLRIECDRCGKVQMVNEAHARWRDRSLRDILARMRHDGCGGLIPRKPDLGFQVSPHERVTLPRHLSRSEASTTISRRSTTRFGFVISSVS